MVVRDRTPFKAELLAQLPKLKLFLFTGARNTQLDAAALKARGIPVGNTEMGASKDSTTEIAWALILAAAKRLEAYLALVRAGEWRDGGGLPVTARGAAPGRDRLRQHRLAGGGQVGKAFGMDVVDLEPAHDGGARGEGRGEVREPRGAAVDLEGGEPAPGARAGDAQAHQRRAPGHHAPGFDPREHRALGAHRHGGAARGARRGRPGIAALDVYDDEPLPAGNTLAKRPNVVLTPHLGFVNDPVFSKFGPGVVENLLAVAAMASRSR